MNANLHPDNSLEKTDYEYHNFLDEYHLQSAPTPPLTPSPSQQSSLQHPYHHLIQRYSDIPQHQQQQQQPPQNTLKIAENDIYESLSGPFVPASILGWGSESPPSSLPQPPRSIENSKLLIDWKTLLKFKKMEISFTSSFKVLARNLASLILGASDGSYQPWKCKCSVIVHYGFLCGNEYAWKIACLFALTDHLKISPVSCISHNTTLPITNNHQLNLRQLQQQIHETSRIQDLIYRDFGWEPSLSNSLHSENKILIILQFPDLFLFEKIISTNWGMFQLSSISILSSCPDYEQAKHFPFLYRILPFMVERTLVPATTDDLTYHEHSHLPSPSISSTAHFYSSTYLAGFKLFQFPLAILHQLESSFWDMSQ